jgi:crotonobetaine/carnitine-CoA ligase
MALRLDPRMPRPDACMQRYMFDRLAASQPDKVFVNFADGTEWTYSQTREIAIRAANAFRKLGVRQGERVLVWVHNCADCLRVGFGLNYLGAVFVPINLAYRGTLLQHTAMSRKRASAWFTPTCISGSARSS